MSHLKQHPVSDHNPHDRDHHGHNHDHHGHDHSAGPSARQRHVLSEALGGHFHDTSDQVDDALEDDAAGRRALLISLGLVEI